MSGLAEQSRQTPQPKTWSTMVTTLLLLSLYATISSSAPLNDGNNDLEPRRPTATIDSGVVVGTAVVEAFSKATVVQYLGVPFAASPRRFGPPQKPESWNSPYDASSYKPACVQKFDYPDEKRKRLMAWFNSPPSPAGESEDCLNLNVYAPATASSRRLKPVLFWLYGGGFNFGTGSLPLYDGSSFAANQDLVVVTSNYRTNVFGFPGSPELKTSEKNLGWLDQRLALDWVQRNIAALGGDPQQVTIAGESAGAGSVDALVTTPPSPLSFRGAIMQSGQGSIYKPSNDSETSWEVLAKAFKCPKDDTMSCLRRVPASKLKDVMERENLSFGPVRDGGATWTNDPRKARRASTSSKSSIARVPIVIGTNSDEGLTFVWGITDAVKYIHNAWPEIPDKMIDLALKLHYPIGKHGIVDGFQQIARIYTEFAMQCPAKMLAADSTRAKLKTWRYYFNAGFPNTQISGDSGAWHSSEIGLIFGTYPREDATPFQAELSNTMQAAWGDFVKNPDEGPGWAPAPRVAVIGGGARGDDGPDRKSKAVDVVNPWLLDVRCSLFDNVLDEMSGVK